MGVFENFPYANFHELNLDWIIKALKESITTMQAGVEYVEQIKKQVDDLDLTAASSKLNTHSVEIAALMNIPVFVEDDIDFEQLQAWPPIPATTGGVRIGKIENLDHGLWIFQAVVTAMFDNSDGTPAATVHSQMLNILGVEDANGHYTHTSRNTVPVSGGGAHCSCCTTLIANVEDGEKVVVYAQKNPIDSAEDEAEKPQLIPTHMHLRGYRLNYNMTASNS